MLSVSIVVITLGKYTQNNQILIFMKHSNHFNISRENKLFFAFLFNTNLVNLFFPSI